MNNRYHTPNISEFVQGFEFEILENHDYSMVILDFKNNTTEEVGSTHYERWEPRTVWWKHDPKEMITEQVGEFSVTVTGGFVNFFSPYSDERLIKLIEDGRIRSK